MKKVWFGLIGFAALITACPSSPAPDTQAPTVTLTSSSTNVTAAGSITLTATATDDTGVTKVEFYDGATKLGDDTGSPYTFDVAFTAANNGAKSYTAKAFDAAGNTATSSPATAVTVNISAVADTQAPTVSLVSSSPSVTAAGNITLTATAIDNVGVTKVEFYEAATKLGEDTSSPYTQVVGLTFADNGTKSYTAKAFDAAGNTAVSNPATQVTVNAPLSAFIRLGGALDFFLTHQVDTASGISLAVDSAGNPVVAWSEWDGQLSKDIYVKRWNGTAWQLVGTTFLDVNVGQDAFSPSLTLDSSGNPIVAWCEGDGASSNVYVKRWNGSS